MKPAICFLCLALLFVVAVVPSVTSAQEGGASELEGLWVARLRFGPDIRGTLRVEHDRDGWHAEIAGIRVAATTDGDVITFALPAERGDFRGRLEKSRIQGHWTAERTQNTGGRHASPVTLERAGKSEQWSGTVDPFDDEFTMYLKVSGPAGDGAMRAFLRNPERNVGWFIPVTTIEREGTKIRVRGPRRNGAEVISEGTYLDHIISIPLRGGTYDFRRVSDGEATDYHARSFPKGGASYRYSTPPALADGWPVAAPEEVGMSRDALENVVRTIIDIPLDSLSTPEIHAVLIARHGKLVLEEYFHGEHRDKPHDLRSASKSMTAMLAGAAEASGARLGASTRVYEAMNGGAFADGLEPRRRAMTLEHLLTMSPGLACNDWDDDSPGGEDRMGESGVADLWQATMALEMINDPGAKAFYCSMGANLVGGVVRHATGRPLLDVYDELLMQPLQIRRYWLGMMGNGEPYGGGGMRLLPRDFMKFGQLVLNGGTWNRKRVLSEAWVERATSPLVMLDGRFKYGYLWWIDDFKYQERTITGYRAGGNGGQVVVAIPELDMVVTFLGGNYNDLVMYYTLRTLLPERILPAVMAK